MTFLLPTGEKRQPETTPNDHLIISYRAKITLQTRKSSEICATFISFSDLKVITISLLICGKLHYKDK